MPVFVWKGRTLGGEIQTGELTVDSQDEALAALRKKRIIITSVREKRGGRQVQPCLRSGPPVTTRDLAIFTRQFATMINAGLPLVQCLDILSKQTEKATFRRDHRPTSCATSRPARRWPRPSRRRSTRRSSTSCSCNMVEAGEAGGILDEILMRLATFIEKAEALKRKVQSAMVYPAVVMTVAIVATTFMLIFIIPTFAKIFIATSAASCRCPTKIVMVLSDFLRRLLVDHAGRRHRR